MTDNNNIGEVLPCGGYVEEDKFIKDNMKKLSLQSHTGQKQAQNVSCESNVCCQQSCNDKQKSQTKCCSENEAKKEQSKQQVNKIEQKKVEETNDRKKINPVCKKCKTEPSVLIHKNEPICRACILKNIEYKCRLTLQNTIKVNGKSKILICFSGGLNSICLVNILASIRKRYQKHHLFGELRCIHIQQQSTIPEGYKSKFQQQTGIPLEIIRIEEVFADKSKTFESVREIFSMFNKGGNTADLLQLFRDRLILDYAKQHQFDFIMKGLNGESIAGSIFKYFTKGIGGNVTELSSNEKDCLYHFPLRQHLQKELQYYFYTMKCSKLSLMAEKDDLSNVCTNILDENLNEFILNLQTMYTHTAPAVTRTAEKIQSNRSSQVRCGWCMLKGAAQPEGLCRKCLRIYESRNKNFDLAKVPTWLKIVQ